MKLSKDVIIIIMTIIANACLLFVINYYFVPINGEVRYGNAITIGDKLYYQVQIENFTPKEIAGLRLTVPLGSDIHQIISNTPVAIEPILNTIKSDVSLVSISNILPSGTTQIFFPILRESDQSKFNFLNLENHKFNYKSMQQVHSRFFLVLKKIFITSIVYAVIYMFLGVLFIWYLNKQDEKIKKLTESSREISEELKRVSLSHQKCRLLLLSRLKDYVKENDFWKDTIRKVMYENENAKSSDQLFDIVTDSLKTYSIHSGCKDADTIHLMASMLKDGEQIIQKGQ